MAQVDICVLVHNQADVTSDFTKNIFDMVKPGLAKFWFLDNGSTEPEVGRLFQYLSRATSRFSLGPYRRHNAKFYKAYENMMFSGGNNFLARKGKAPWILFLNNDAFPEDPEWLDRLLWVARLKGWAAVGPASNRVMGIQSDKWTKSLMRLPMLHGTQVLSGFCFLVRRSVFEKLGGWDEQFENGDEDLDLSVRIRADGGKLGVHRGVHVHHLCSQSLEPWAAARGESVADHFAKTRAQLLEKHTQRVQHDLWFWEHHLVPKSQWSKMGVMPNGYYHSPPGRAKDQVRAFYAGQPARIFFKKQLHPAAPAGGGAGATYTPAGKLHPWQGFEYHLGCLEGGGFALAAVVPGCKCYLPDDGRSEGRKYFCGHCEEKELIRERAKDGDLRNNHAGTLRPAGPHRPDDARRAVG